MPAMPTDVESDTHCPQPFNCISMFIKIMSNVKAVTFVQFLGNSDPLRASSCFLDPIHDCQALIFF